MFAAHNWYLRALRHDPKDVNSPIEKPTFHCWRPDESSDDYQDCQSSFANFVDLFEHIWELHSDELPHYYVCGTVLVKSTCVICKRQFFDSWIFFHHLYDCVTAHHKS